MVISESQLREQASESLRVPLNLQSALTQEHLALIGPLMKGSPVAKCSRHRFAASVTAKEDQEQGADALMVCTEETFYEGQQKYVGEIRAYTQIPILLYDYIIQPYQLYAAASLGADAVVLMTSVLNPDTMILFMQTLQQLGLQAVVEVHSESDVEAGLQSGASMFLINNLSLDGTGSLDVTKRLAPMVPAGDVAISWGGITTMEALSQVCSWGCNAACPAPRMFRDTPRHTLSRLVRELGAPAERV